MESDGMMSRLLAAMILLAVAANAAEELGWRTVIVYNDREPEGRALAEYYAHCRHVPTNQIFAVHARPVCREHQTACGALRQPGCAQYHVAARRGMGGQP